jgi:hypothetical protein
MGASVIISSALYGKTILEKEKYNQKIESVGKALMNMKETADYLNLTEDQVKHIIASEKSELSSRGTYTGVMFPYVKINGQFYVSKNELNDWVKDVTIQKREY